MPAPNALNLRSCRTAQMKAVTDPLSAVGWRVAASGRLTADCRSRPAPPRCYIQEVIKSAVIPVAGHGTRLLPATKSQPKEMLPVARKPIVQYVAEELIKNKIDQILFITGRNKTSIENHFDTDPELLRTLTAANRQDLIDELQF